MKIKNNNVYKIMFGLEFIGAGEVKEIDDKETIKLLLSQPNVEEFVDKDDLKQIEEENKKLKAELEKKEAAEKKVEKETKAKAKK